jgi:hypothetical protein
MSSAADKAPSTKYGKVLNRLYGGRRLSYQWEDTSILESVWNSNTSAYGHSFVFCEDQRGTRRYRPISYEIRQHAGGLIALWGKGVGKREDQESCCCSTHQSGLLTRDVRIVNSLAKDHCPN